MVRILDTFNEDESLMVYALSLSGHEFQIVPSLLENGRDSFYFPNATVSREDVRSLITKRKLEEADKEIESHIYGFYPLNKQQQDDKWFSYFTFKLKAAGITNTEFLVLQCAKIVKEGTGIERVVSDVLLTLDSGVLAKFSGTTDELRRANFSRMLQKLVAVALRTEWADATALAGNSVLGTTTAPTYPSFEDFNAK